MQIRFHVDDHDYSVDFVNTQYMTKRIGVINSLHRHPVYHIMYITDGKGRFQVNDRITRAEEGLLYIISPNELHQFIADNEEPFSDYESTFLLLKNDGQPCEANFFEIVEHHYDVTLPTEVKNNPIPIPVSYKPLLLEGFQKVINYQKLHFSKEQIRLSILDLLFRAAEIIIRVCGSKISSPGDPDLSIAKLKQFLESNLHRTVSLRELAAVIHVTPNYLCRMFKQSTGLTPMQYLQQVRMAEAKKLLIHTDNPVYFIAEQLGYDDASYFARIFRAEHGTTPSVYRQKYHLT